MQNAVAVRHARTDASGKFTFDPVPPGAYQIEVTNTVWDPKTETRRTVPVPGAFEKVPVVVEYKSANTFPPVTVRAVEHVMFALQYVDSSGRPRTGNSVFLSGKRGGETYLATGTPDANGRVRVFVPKGVTDARVSLITDPYSSLRWRRGAHGKLLSKIETASANGVELGSLDADVTDFVVVRYDAPVLVVRAVDAAGKLVPGVRASVRYAGVTPSTRDAGRGGRDRADVSLDKQDDGSWRTSQLLPDAELDVSAEVKGYTTTRQRVMLKEKETREVTIQLRKS